MTPHNYTMTKKDKLILSFKSLQKKVTWKVWDILAITTVIFWWSTNSVPEIIAYLDAVVLFFLVADFAVFYRELNKD